MMLGKQKRVLVGFMILMLSLSTLLPNLAPKTHTALAAKKVVIRLQKKQIRVPLGKTVTLKVKKLKGASKVKWTCSDKSVVSLRKSKKKVDITGKKNGTAVIYAKVGKTYAACSVIVGTGSSSSGQSGTNGSSSSSEQSGEEKKESTHTESGEITLIDPHGNKDMAAKVGQKWTMRVKHSKGLRIKIDAANSKYSGVTFFDHESPTISDPDADGLQTVSFTVKAAKEPGVKIIINLIADDGAWDEMTIGVL